MRNHVASAALAAVAVLLTGCASAQSDSPSHPPSPAMEQMTPGMVMPDGSTMGAPAPSATAAGSSGPSAAAQMICSADIRSAITTVLKLPSAPVARSSWVNHVYTCTYQLPMGELVLSVTESGTEASANAYLEGLRQRLGAQPLIGLTPLAYGTGDGVVVLVKDTDTLRVDASRLPRQFGDQGQKRADFAYELASDILGCWTGEDD
jgi:hypothetical protein